MIIGGGLAGLVTGLELLDAGKRVVLLDRDEPRLFGGLARRSFGGVFLVNTPQQRRMGIRDNESLALSDWRRVAQFGPQDELPRKWAESYVQRSSRDIYHWLSRYGVRFFPVVHWVERGLFHPGNSVPRFHLTWGTGKALVEALLFGLQNHPRRGHLQLCFDHDVQKLLSRNRVVTGCYGKRGGSGEDYTAEAESTVVCGGGICGNLERVRRHWYKPWGEAPEVLLNGSHRYADGRLHDEVNRLGGAVTHLDRQWNYPAGVHHPQPEKEQDGLSLVPPRSALWMNYEGRRIGPVPLITAFDTRYIVQEICRQKKKYSWQILNWKIAVRELAVSGSEYNDAIREKKFFRFVIQVLLGNRSLVADLVENCVDFVTAGSVRELASRMNELTGDQSVNAELLKSEIESYDSMIERGRRFHNDDQLRRIAQLRQYRGDRFRTCRFQKILDPEAMPLIAVREFILTRKSLGGIQTDLESRVLDPKGRVMAGLYAAGEAAGFGGGGIHGIGSLEGTFLGSCILTAQSAARSIAGRSG